MFERVAHGHAAVVLLLVVVGFVDLVFLVGEDRLDVINNRYGRDAVAGAQ